jgi:hypothetical protein
MRKIIFSLALLLAPALSFPQGGTPPGGYGPGSPGAAGGACTGLNCFLPQNYAGYFGDTKEVVDATWVGGGSNVVTFPNSDGPVTADAGRLCWAMPQSMQAGPAAPGVLAVTVTKTSATCTAAAIIGSASGNGAFDWGHDDTPAFVSAVAALYTQPKCGSIVMPAARVMLSQGISYTGTVASDCSINVIGSGNSSTIVLEPGFSFTAVTNNVGCTSLGCFFNTSASTSYLFFSIAGIFQSLSGISTAPASTLFTIGPGSYAIGVNFYNWATAASNGPKGAVINGTGPFGLGFALNTWADGALWSSGNYGIGNNNGGIGVTMKTNGIHYDYAGTYNGLYTNGGEYHGSGTLTTANSGGFGSGSCDLGSSVYLKDAKIGNGSPGANGIGFQFNNLGSGGQCILTAEDTLFKGGTTGSAILSSIAGQGVFIDRGNNTFVGPMNFSGAYVNLTPLAVFGACTGAATASSALALRITGTTTTGAGVPSTCTDTTTLDAGIQMPKAYTIYELLVSASAGGASGGGTVAVLKNGVAQTMTCALSTTTACQDGATAHQVTGSAGDLISLRLTTIAADTPNNVKASLVVE